MFTLAPANKDHQVAIRCAVGVFVPLITLVLLGRLDLAIFASFGAFAGIYGRNEPHGRRFGPAAARGHADAGGDSAGRPDRPGRHRPALSAAGTDLAAGRRDHPGGRWLLPDCRLWRLRPAGSLFHIFAFAAIASIPTSRRSGRACWWRS